MTVLLRSAAAFCIGSILCGCATHDDVAADALLDAPAPALAAELAAGRISAEALVDAVLERIAALDDAGPQLNAIIEINPDAIEIARALDRRFDADGPVGPLHGLPVVLKANIDTADRMATSAGSLALADNHAAEDAVLVTRLRAAGAVIVAKANLSEWANFRGFRSTSGWSSLGGQTRNPWVLDRSPCGSSSGSAVAVAARIVPLAVGTETDGSIVCPAAMNGIVAIKPTHGSVSQAGIIPVASSQDIAGPMARTVGGAALLLASLQDDATAARLAAVDFERTNLGGLRVGVVRDYNGAGTNAALEASFQSWLDLLTDRGTVIVDDIELALPGSVRAAELEVLSIEFKAGINEYLLRDPAWPDELAELIEFNAANADAVMPYFGQERFVIAEQSGGLDSPEYFAAIENSATFVRHRLEAVFSDWRLDAITAPVTAPAFSIDYENGDAFSLSSNSIAAISGYPSVVVPGGLIDGLPVAIAFIGVPNSEARLLEIAGVFEAVRGPFPRPDFIESLAEPVN